MSKETSSTREAQRRYRSRQKAKLEDFKQQVDLLNKRLKDLDVKNAGLTSQNRILEEAAAAVQAKQQKADEEAECNTPIVWDARAGKALADYANYIRPTWMLVELSPEEGRKLTVEEISVYCKDFYDQIAAAVAAPTQTAETTRVIARMLSAKRAFRDAMEFMGAKASTGLIAQLTSTMKYKQPTIEVVRQGVEMLQLSDEQKADLLAARRRLLRKHLDIKAERVQIVHRMHETSDKARRGDDQATSMSHLLEEVEALEELKSNLEREHVSTYSFHSTFSDTLTQFQYAKTLAFNRAQHVKPWPIVQMLAAQEAEARCEYSTRQASIQDLEGTVEFGLSAATDASAGAWLLSRGQATGAPNGVASTSANSASNESADTQAVSAQGPNAAANPLAPIAASGDHRRTDSAAMSVSENLDTLLDGNFFDDVLTDLQDPLDLDFGQPNSGAGEPLWNLVQNFSGDNTVGV